MLGQYNISLQLGDACISVKCADAAVMDRIRFLYGDFLCEAVPDIDVDLTVTERVKPLKIQDPKHHSTFYHQEGRFYHNYHQDHMISGEYDFQNRKVSILLEKQVLNEDPGSFYLNQLMCYLYYSCRYVNNESRPLSQIMHSSAVVRNGQGFLFVGPSGIGKTTIARMAGSITDTTVINDEGNLVSVSEYDDPAVTVSGIPIIGKLKERHSTSAPLGAVLFLKQGKKTSLKPLEKTEAFKRLMFQIVGDLYFGQHNKNAILTSKVVFSEAVTRIVPCYDLEFSLDETALRDVLDTLHQQVRREHGVFA